MSNNGEQRFEENKPKDTLMFKHSFETCNVKTLFPITPVLCCVYIW